MGGWPGSVDLVAAAAAAAAERSEPKFLPTFSNKNSTIYAQLLFRARAKVVHSL
ncbi:hypothetical protein TYRP_023461, partial [Tyrophagus putrescentiae]